MIANNNPQNLEIQLNGVENEKNRITIRQAINNFPNYLFLEGKSKSTSENYLTDTIQFYTFIKTELNNKIRYIDAITKVEIKQYKKHLIKKMMKGEYKITTIARKYNSLKVFCQFLENEYGIEDITKGDKFGNRNHLKNWNNDYEVESPPKIIQDWEIEKLLQTIESSNDKNVFRDMAIIQVLLNTGCRRSELLELKWSDVNFYNKEITIRRKKTSNADTVAVNHHVIKALIDLKKVNGDLKSSDYIFRSRQESSNKLSESALNSAIKKWVIKANINPEISSHYFRHTFITNCLRQGISAEKIIKYTGHSDVSALKPYTHLVANDTREVAQALEKNREV